MAADPRIHILRFNTPTQKGRGVFLACAGKNLLTKQPGFCYSFLREQWNTVFPGGLVLQGEWGEMPRESVTVMLYRS